MVLIEKAKEMSQDPTESSVRVRFFLVSAVVSLSLLGDSLLYAVLPARSEDFHVMVWQVGVLLGANRLVRLITNELAGRVIQHSNSEKPLLLAVLVGSLITASYTLSWGFWGLLAARMIWGACWSVLRVEGYISALESSTAKNRGRIFALYQVITRAGSGGGVLIGGFLSDLLGIRATFLLFCAVSALGVPLVLKTPRSMRESVISQRERQPRLSMDKSHILLWSCALGISLIDQMFSNLTGRIVVDRIVPGLPYVIGVASLTGLLLSFRSIGSLIIAPLAGILGDLLGRRKFLFVLSLSQIAIIVTLAISTYWLPTTLLLVIQFMTSIASRLIVYSMAGDRAVSEARAIYMSRFATFTDLGTAVGPMLGFSLYAGIGFPGVVVPAVMLLVLVAVFLRRLS
jgi:predicted MFS family arabinose efflux permease